MKWYYYLHTEGDLIGKNPVVVDSDVQYFDSPFVKKVWLIETTDRTDAWNLAVEALAMGAKTEKVKELAVKWGLTAVDLEQYILRNTHPTDLQRDGMDKFIREVLALEPNSFWDGIISKHSK